MPDVNLVYSDERETWNVIVDGEWYYESDDYYQAERCADSFLFGVDEYGEGEYYGDCGDDDWNPAEYDLEEVID